MMTTIEYLRTQLAMIDRRLEGYKIEDKIARSLFPHKPRPVVEPTEHKFLVLVESTEYVEGKKGTKGKVVDTIRSYPLTAPTKDAKFYATTLHKETDCIVRVV